MKLEPLLYSILSIQSPSYKEERMIAFLYDHCVGKGYRVSIIDKNVYVVKGNAETYPCYVAHTDTCASIVPDKNYTVAMVDDNTIVGYDFINQKFTQVGFDDKNGIFIALKMLERIPHGKAFFPFAEEVGCVGTRKAKMEFFLDCEYLIQCDRRNAYGIVDKVGNTELFGDDFRNLLMVNGTKYNRKFVDGMLTDVYTLKTMDLGVACVNLECGYYNPHTDDDYCLVDELYATLDFVTDIHKTSDGQVFKHEYKPYVPPLRTFYNGGTYSKKKGKGTSKANNRGQGSAEDYDDWYNDTYGPYADPYGYGSLYGEPAEFFHETKKEDEEEHCESCRNLDKLTKHNKTQMYLCQDCIDVYDGYVNKQAFPF